MSSAIGVLAQSATQLVIVDNDNRLCVLLSIVATFISFCYCFWESNKYFHSELRVSGFWRRTLKINVQDGHSGPGVDVECDILIASRPKSQTDSENQLRNLIAC